MRNGKEKDIVSTNTLPSCLDCAGKLVGNALIMMTKMTTTTEVGKNVTMVTSKHV